MIGDEKSGVISIPALLARATLDVIGEGLLSLMYVACIRLTVTLLAAFDYEFNAIEDDNNALSRSYQNIMCVVQLQMTC